MLGFIYFIDVSETLLAIGRISSPTRDYTLCYRGNFTALLSLIFVSNFFGLKHNNKQILK